MTIFGRIVHGGSVEDAAVSTLRLWLPTYLVEMERQTGREPGSLPQIRSWSAVSDFSQDIEDQLPAGLVICAGLADDPTKDGRGVYSAPWALGVAVIASARDQATTRRLAMVYSAAIRATLLQRPSLGGLASALDWIDERYDDIPDEAGRSIAAGRNTFRVEVGDALTVRGGPATPVYPEPEPDPQFQYENTTADRVVVDLQSEGTP